MDRPANADDGLSARELEALAELDELRAAVGNCFETHEPEIIEQKHLINQLIRQQKFTDDNHQAKYDKAVEENRHYHDRKYETAVAEQKRLYDKALADKLADKQRKFDKAVGDQQRKTDAAEKKMERTLEDNKKLVAEMAILEETNTGLKRENMRLNQQVVKLRRERDAALRRVITGGIVAENSRLTSSSRVERRQGRVQQNPRPIDHSGAPRGKKLYKWYLQRQTHHNGGKIWPSRYGSDGDWDLGLCYTHFLTHEKCYHGTECEYRHEKLDDSEKAYILQLQGERFLRKIDEYRPDKKAYRKEDK